MNASENVNTIQLIKEKSNIALHLWKRSASDDQNGAEINSINGRIPISVPIYNIFTKLTIHTQIYIFNKNVLNS